MIHAMTCVSNENIQVEQVMETKEEDKMVNEKYRIQVLASYSLVLVVDVADDGLGQVQAWA